MLGEAVASKAVTIRLELSEKVTNNESSHEDEIIASFEIRVERPHDFQSRPFETSLTSCGKLKKTFPSS